MEIKTTYNFDFLDNYFTSKEFDFINNANLENEKLDEIILRETKTRDIIVNFINNLHNYTSNENNNNNADLLALLTEVQDIFEKINNNIKIVQELKNTSSKIFDNIVELLIAIEESPNNQENYHDQIQELKNMINNISAKNEDVRSKILLNDIKIDTFFQKNIVKKYLSSFDTEFVINNNKEISNNIKSLENNWKNELNYTQTKQLESNNKEENYKQPLSFINYEEIQENHTLVVSEKSKKVFLPFTKNEISLYLEQYPNSYTSLKDVIRKEFVLSLDYYIKHPVIARFREAYSLIRDREAKSVIDAFKFAIDIMFRYELNPVIIAACKTQEQLEHYMACLEKNKLDDFKDFEIRFEINPLA